MNQLIVKNVLDWLNEIAPFETAESYDNVGLLVGSSNAAGTCAHTNLSATKDTC